jgi:hypothetical protein
VDEHRYEYVDPRLTEQLLRLGDVSGNRLARKDARELVREPIGGLLDVMSGDRIEDVRRRALLTYRRRSMSMMARSSTSVNMCV